MGMLSCSVLPYSDAEVSEATTNLILKWRVVPDLPGVCAPQ